MLPESTMQASKGRKHTAVLPSHDNYKPQGPAWHEREVTLDWKPHQLPRGSEAMDLGEEPTAAPLPHNLQLPSKYLPLYP